MKVAILGAGPAGATLHKLLASKAGTQVDIFGKREQTACGIKPCAWGVNRVKFFELCDRLGLTPGSYCTNHCESFRLWRLKLPCDVVMLNKALLLSDLLGANISYGQPKLCDYDRVIDATGSNGGKVRATYQVQVEASLPLSISIGLHPVLHCTWSFPLSPHTAHLGVMALSDTLRGLDKGLISRNPICQCYSRIHSQGLVNPLVEDGTWKVGERAGAVDPITGSGVLTSMTSAILLFENWDNPEGYERVMKERFGYTTNKIRALLHNEFRGLPIKLM